MRRLRRRRLEFFACDVRCVFNQCLIHIMRTNIDIDEPTLEAAMRAGPFKTKKEAVEAGLKLLARQAAYREMLKWEGKLHWDGDSELGSEALHTSEGPTTAAAPWSVQEAATKRYAATRTNVKAASARAAPKKAPHGRR